MQINRRLMKWLLPIMIVVFLLVSCQSIVGRLEGEQLVNRDTYSYSIDTEKILENLKYGISGNFTKIETHPYNLPIVITDINWISVDYDLVSESLMEVVWGESVNFWQLNQKIYYWDCAQTDRGPQSAYYEYFKVQELETESSRILSEVVIEPRRKSVSVTMKEYFPVIVTWDQIDSSFLGLSPEKILNIAESEGGESLRLGVANNCTITIKLHANLQDYWVHYSGITDGKNTFIIDAKDGSVDLNN